MKTLSYFFIGIISLIVANPDQLFGMQNDAILNATVLMQKYSQECPICWQTLNPTESLMHCCNTNMQHFFHQACFQQWLSRTTTKGCIVCFKSVENFIIPLAQLKKRSKQFVKNKKRFIKKRSAKRAKVIS